MTHDLVIAGAGPAGLMTAQKASQHGLKVLLLERHQTLTDSLMGELVTQKALSLLNVPDTSECVVNRFKSIVGESLDTGSHIAVDRTLLGNSYLLDEDSCQELMRDRAVSNGAELKCQAKVDSVIKEGEQVVGVKYNGNQESRASLTVGADGSFSKVSSSAGFAHPRWLLSYGYRFKLEGCRIEDPHTAYFYVGRDVGLGYLWLYPRSESETNLGIGRVPSSRLSWERLPPMKDVLMKYMRKHEETKNARIANVNGGVVPCTGLIPSFTGAGVALCGNAAGQVSSIVGGGVTTCLHAGTLLAKHAKRMVEENDYSRESTLLYEKEYRKSRLARSIMNTGNGMYAVSKYAMLNDPVAAAETVLSQLDASTLNDVIQGRLKAGTILSLMTDFLPLVVRIGAGYVKSVAITGV
ncbi:MAG: hypothetical protein C4K49_12220 [Candidatus Thorarchaeota archaeon]|nr:MAG: hypothetical protein C4K49_12220 [Candidatus Thorarchaeota archaeon]